MFGKRKKQVTPEKTAQKSAENKTSQSNVWGGFKKTNIWGGGHTPELTIIVAESSMKESEKESWYLVQAIVDYTNNVMEMGLYNRDELPQKVMQVYHADYYLAQVNNGGHSQFIHNAGVNFQHTVEDALQGLKSMGAEGCEKTLDDMIGWVAQNANEAASQDGFDSRSSFLDELDTRFYAANNETAMQDFAARWIRSWPELRVVPDELYQAEIEQIGHQNPERNNRLIARRILRVNHSLTDPLRVSMGLAASVCQPSRYLIDIGGGGYEDIPDTGESEVAWLVKLHDGLCFGVMREDSTALYERIEADNPPMPDISDEEGMSAAISDGRFAQFQPPTVGTRLSKISKVEIDAFIQKAEHTKVAAAVDKLLIEANLNPNDIDAFPIHRDGDQGDILLNLGVVANETLFQVIVYESGAILVPAGGEPIASVPAVEILQHWSLTEALKRS